MFVRSYVDQQGNLHACGLVCGAGGAQVEDRPEFDLDQVTCPACLMAFGDDKTLWATCPDHGFTRFLRQEVCAWWMCSGDMGGHGPCESVICDESPGLVIRWGNR